MVKKKSRPFWTGAFRSIDVESETGTRPSDLDAGFAHAAALLDDDIAVTIASADRDVAIPVHAVPVAQRTDAVFPAEALGARGERKRGRTRHGDRNGDKVGCSHPRASFGLPAMRSTRNSHRKFRPRCDAPPLNPTRGFPHGNDAISGGRLEPIRSRLR